MVRFKAIKQKREFDAKKVKQAIISEMNKVGKEMAKDLREPTQSWSGVKPIIGYEIESAFQPTLVVKVKSGGLGAKKFGWLNDGTKPHLIVGNPLAFQANSRPKTMPGTLRPSSGGSSGAMVFTTVVHHPGIEPRNFEKALVNKWRKPFNQRMREAYLRGLAATGHGM